MLAIAQKLEGLHRHASTHAAGVVIGDRPLEELVPLYRDPKTGMRVTQYNMKWVEQAGLVKFDFLGLKTLTVLRTAVDLLKARGVAIDLSSLPLDDAKTYETLRPRRDGRRVPGGKRRHAQGARRHAAPTASRTSSPSSRSTARGRWPTSRSIASASSARRGQRGELVPAPEARADPARRPSASSSTRSR